MTGGVWVMDCSAASAFFLDEAASASIDPLISGAARQELTLLVPSLFWFELLNVLISAQRRGRIPHAQAVRLRNEADLLPLTVDPPLGSVQRLRVHDLAVAHKLTAYDAAYLELAERKGARLKSLDPDLLALGRKYPWIE